MDFETSGLMNLVFFILKTFDFFEELCKGRPLHYLTPHSRSGPTDVIPWSARSIFHGSEFI